MPADLEHEEASTGTPIEAPPDPEAPSDPAAPPNPPSELPFEDILERLQRVVARLEGGDLPLEESIAVFEEGVRLSRLGARRLDEAERRVERLLSGDRTEPLASAEGDGP